MDELGYEPQTALEPGMEEAVRWAKENSQV
jgi:nucleoside-diphosphate-sugar epimerase